MVIMVCIGILDTGNEYNKNNKKRIAVMLGNIELWVHQGT